MALQLASPGIQVREVDLTRGGIDNTINVKAGISAPFQKGPVNEIVTITNEKELVDIFGEPSSKVDDYQFEYWYACSNFLSYGGQLDVIRCGGGDLNNGNVAVGASAQADLVIENFDDYNNNHESATTWYWAAKNPGFWGQELKVVAIDAAADQRITGILTTSIPSTTFSTAQTGVATVGVGSTLIFLDSYTGINTSQTIEPVTGVIGENVTVVGLANTVGVAVTEGGEEVAGVLLSTASINAGAVTGQTLNFGEFVTSFDNFNIQAGYAVTQALDGTQIGIGTTSDANGYLKGVITGVGASYVDIKVTSYISGLGTATNVDYQENSLYEFKVGTGKQIGISSVTLGDVGILTGTAAKLDWYDQQNLMTSLADGGSDPVTVSWRSVLGKPRTNIYVSDRNGRFDGLNVAVIDLDGSITGNPGAILEKFGNLSKAADTEVSPNKSVYYKKYLAENSKYIYAGVSLVNATDTFHNTAPRVVGFQTATEVGLKGTAAGAWGQEAKDVVFNGLGNAGYVTKLGRDYQGVGSFNAPLGDVLTGYDVLADPVRSDIRFLLQGGASGTKEEEQAKANKLIAICEARKDCVAFISPNRDSVINVTSEREQLNNVLSFFAPVSSSSFAVLDAGYQYVYDRFNKKFAYMPCSNDVAGLCVRTDRDQFPWFSPAGTNRGSLNFAVKLAFNPGQDSRDRLYSNRINPIVSKTGAGICLFGDKTALAYESAFDRINVRRLFITIEQAIENAAQAQLFEINDVGTRSNFVNIVEPYLRDVQAKRGIYDFLVVCDDSNNTPDVIDRNEFIADIYVKPARSINFIGLTFVATRTGVAFSEIVGNV